MSEPYVLALEQALTEAKVEIRRLFDANEALKDAIIECHKNCTAYLGDVPAGEG